ncbi:MAG TPA: NPCBM/NEW2 domain-containing protein [Anaerohalosphaeraceae bacterium]|nr:NPCBM/NEW2 domain-containing protein [Anaerohalosphaeraceae bacterium]
MNSLPSRRQIDTLILKLLENTISDEEIQQLDELFAAHPELVRHYCEFVIHYNTVRTKFQSELPSAAASLLADSSIDERFWGELAHEEKSAPAVEVPAALKEPNQEEKPKVQTKTMPRVSKLSLYSLILSSAALFFVLVYAFFSPPGSGMEVATVSDALNAKWDTKQPLQPGSRLVTKSKPLFLYEGIVKLAFDNGSTLIFEGPSKFEILTEDQVHLTFGRLYAIVPSHAVGFIVSTANSKVIDLGTEFGVKAEPDGQTEVHVLAGKTLLISGTGSNPKNHVEITRGQAKAIAKNGTVQDIPLKKESFVRHIHSQTGLVWRGQTQLNLADMAGGGNGLGTGKNETGIDPLTGRPSAILFYNRASSNEYHPCSFSPYVDGVFIPDGRTLQIVSSEGHVFENCPPTSGWWFTSIVSSLRPFPWPAPENSSPAVPPFVNCLVMHANMGITFDLQTLRKDLSGARIVRFRSYFGIEGNAIRPEAGNADFWVLVDGKMRFRKSQVKVGQFDFAEIELTENDRFLTLMTTDGGDSPERFSNGLKLTTIDSDWCLFAEPVLILE